ncbi:helix-turn-helix domain-containing protein [Stappia sp. ES.058]|uniref:helix-turn-helix domain-containing protein n=1 Tax=Stappia sp. ES.058 TaxID=1881061 RepID=UPI001AD8AAF9|nr:helix-turn-helix domain-containing protein [Stappia sp. ES.058]
MQVNQRETTRRPAISGAGVWQKSDDLHGTDGSSRTEGRLRAEKSGSRSRGQRAGLAGDGGAPGEMDPRGADLIVMACVVAVFGVSQQELAARSRGLAHVALARQVAMYLHHVVLRRTLTAVADRFARDRTTVAHACRVVEDRRDDPAFEELLDAIERAVQGALGPLCQSRRGRG